MAATVGDLREYITAREPETKLVTLTNHGAANNPTTINTTTFEAYCLSAINSFQARNTTYNPDVYGLHRDIAWYLVMALLYDRANNEEKAKEYRAKADDAIPGIRPETRRSFDPVSDSPWTPSELDTTVEQRPTWDRERFEGYRAK